MSQENQNSTDFKPPTVLPVPATESEISELVLQSWRRGDRAVILDFGQGAVVIHSGENKPIDQSVSSDSLPYLLSTTRILMIEGVHKPIVGIDLCIGMDEESITECVFVHPSKEGLFFNSPYKVHTSKLVAEHVCLVYQKSETSISLTGFTIEENL